MRDHIWHYKWHEHKGSQLVNVYWSEKETNVGSCKACGLMRFKCGNTVTKEERWVYALKPYVPICEEERMPSCDEVQMRKALK